ncbi:MAG: SPOR domain-containing protein [Rhodocyclaceae bacterium]|nr:MAG: SPOR domain-containing protein [Rhodocyclaceae bacterium]
MRCLWPNEAGMPRISRRLVAYPSERPNWSALWHEAGGERVHDRQGRFAQIGRAGHRAWRAQQVAGARRYRRGPDRWPDRCPCLVRRNAEGCRAGSARCVVKRRTAHQAGARRNESGKRPDSDAAGSGYPSRAACGTRADRGARGGKTGSPRPRGACPGRQSSTAGRGQGGEPSSPHRVSQSVASGRAGALEQAPKEHVAESPAKPMKAEVPSPAKPPNGFVLQVGVFSNVANAEDLRKRLVDAGIPAHIEARVQVGPFASQAEAVAAQQKLRALGMEPGMLIAPKRP